MNFHQSEPSTPSMPWAMEIEPLEQASSPAPSLMYGSDPTNSPADHRTPSPPSRGSLRFGNAKGDEDLFGLGAQLPTMNMGMDMSMDMNINMNMMNMDMGVGINDSPTMATLAFARCEKQLQEEHSVPAASQPETAAPVPAEAAADFMLIPCANLERAAEFYSRCFGWTFLGDMNKPEDMSDAAMRRRGSSRYDSERMNFFASGPAVNGGNKRRVSGALVESITTSRAHGPATSAEDARSSAALRGRAVCHLRVGDIGDAADRIEDNQGLVKSLRFGVRGCMMDIGEFVDPEGNLFGLVAYHAPAEVEV